MWDFFAGLLRRLFEHRNIFRFWDGRRYRRIDPWTAYRATLDYDGWNWDETPKLIAQDGEEAAMLRLKLDAIQTAVDMVRKVFNVRTVDQRGLTEEECIALLWQFSSFVFAVKKNGRQPQTSPQPSDSPQAEATKPDSGFGLTDTESGHEMRSGFPEESPGG